MQSLTQIINELANYHNRHRPYQKIDHMYLLNVSLKCVQLYRSIFSEPLPKFLHGRGFYTTRELDESFDNELWQFEGNEGHVLIIESNKINEDLDAVIEQVN